MSAILLRKQLQNALAKPSRPSARHGTGADAYSTGKVGRKAELRFIKTGVGKAKRQQKKKQLQQKQAVAEIEAAGGNSGEMTEFGLLDTFSKESQEQATETLKNNLEYFARGVVRPSNDKLSEKTERYRRKTEDAKTQIVKHILKTQTSKLYLKNQRARGDKRRKQAS
ncbi:hypothetical protein RI367_000875 [Sorochytrium milnesiophthora]